MYHVQITTKTGDLTPICLDTETLDTLLADWKDKVSQITRYKGKSWYNEVKDAYVFLSPNTITGISVGGSEQ